jgi:hypothetical protein
MATMELVLSTPIEQLAPKLIAWNNTELLAQVNKSLENYKGKVYDENSIAEAKADRAALNNFVKSLDSERIRIGKVYAAPYEKFKKEVDEVSSAVKSVALTIDEQVKSYETKKQEEKLAEIKAYFEDNIPVGLKPFVGYEKIHNAKWLNATVKMPAVQKDIDAILDKISQELATIETLKSEDEIELKTIYYNTLSLTEAIRTNERRKAERQRVIEAQKAAAERKAAEEQRVAQQQAQQPAQPPVKEPEQQKDEDAPKFSIAFRITGTAEQINALDEFLKANNLKYEIIK